MITQIKRDQLRDGLITNDKVSPSANIVYSKLNLNNSIQGSDLTDNAKQTVLEYKLEGYWDQILNFQASGSSDNITQRVEEAAATDTHTIDGSKKGVLTTGTGAFGAGSQNYKGQMRLTSNGDPVDDGTNSQAWFELRHENYIPLTGTITYSNTSAIVTGTGTSFTTELEVGSVLVVDEQIIGTVQTITDNTHLTLTANAASSGTDKAFAREGAKGTVTVNFGETTVSGTNTKFTTDFEVGDALVDASNGQTVGYVASIASDTTMTLASGATASLSNATVKKRQYKAYYKKRDGTDYTFASPTNIDMLFIEVFDEYSKPLLASAIGYGFVDVVGVTGVHNHDDRYYTETEMGSTTDGSSGADLVGFTALTQPGWSASSTVQQAIENIVTDLSDTTAGSSGASLIGIESTGNLTSTNVQSALEELQSDIDVINNTLGNGSLDAAYNNGSVVDVDTTDVDWQLTDGRTFKVSTEDSGNPTIFAVTASASGDTVSITADTTIDGELSPKEISGTVYLSQFTTMQEAINYLNTQYGGGTLVVDVDNFDITSEAPITLYSNITIRGFKGRLTTINNTSTSALHFTATDANNIKLIDLRLVGPGQSAAGGGGIFFTRSGNANIAHIYMENVIVEECANNGISINTPILSTFINVKTIKCAGHGFNVWNGTSCNFRDCYAITHTQAGFHLANMTYCELSGCASEACGIAYNLDGSNNITLNACGSEDTLNRSASYPGYAFRITGNNVTLNSCYSKDSIDTAVYITGSNIVLNAFRDLYVNNNPTYSIDNSTGGSTTLIECSFSKGTNFNNQTKIISADIYKASGELKLQDSRTSAIPFSDTSNTSFVDGVSTSIIGAINAAYNAATGANTLDEVYDGETGTRIITMDNGSVEWQISDNYEHNFADTAGIDILSIKALAAGDQVVINGIFTQSGGQVTFGGNVDANAGLDVTGALTQTGGQVTFAGNVDANAGLDVTGNVTVGTSNFTIDGATGNTSIAGTLNVGGASTFQDNVVIQGNLTVQGTQTIVNTETIELADNIIVLNSNYTGGTPTENAGLEVERGTQQNVQIFWDEANDAWAITDLTGTYFIAKTSGVGGALSLDEAYNGGSVVDVDTTDVDWQLTDGRSFKISTEDTGNPTIIAVNANAAGDTIDITANVDITGDTTLDNITINGTVTQSGGQVTFGSNVDANAGLDVTGALTQQTGQVTFDGNVDANAGLDVTGALTQATGQVTFGGNVDANAGLDVTGALTQTGGAFTVNANAASSIVTTAGNLNLTSAAELEFKDQYLTSAVPLSETGESELDNRFTATSIVGALNELKNDVMSIQWKAPVNTYSDLPLSGNTNGDVRLVLDTENIYEWDSTASEWVLISAGAENWMPSVDTKADLPLSGNRDGDVRLVKQYGAMYYWSETDNGWKPFETGTAVDIHYTREDYTATAGQTVFNLTHSYDVGKNTLLVFVNGTLKIAGVDYQETDSTTVTFTSGLNAGDKVNFIIGFAPNNFYGEVASFTASAGQTVINLPFEYLVNNNEIDVFKNGLLMLAGSSNDYIESSSTSITFNQALEAGDLIVVRKARDYTKALDWTGNEYTTTATAGQTKVDWSTEQSWSYTNGAHEIEVFRNGLLQHRGIDYNEDGAQGSIQQSITFIDPLIAGDKIYIRKAGNYGLSNHDHDLLYTRTADLNSTANGKGASLIGIEDADGYFTSTNVEGALKELYENQVAVNTFDEIYHQETGIRIINQDNGSIEWRISDNYEHNFTDSAGNDILSVKALAAGDQVVITGILNQSGGQVTFDGNVDANAGLDVTGNLTQATGQVTFNGNVDANSGLDANSFLHVNGDFVQHNGSFSLTATTTSNLTVLSANLNLITSTNGNIALTSAGEIQFNDSRTASAITLSDASNTAFADGVSTSIIGAINKAYQEAVGANTLDEVYDGETGTRIITMDNGSVEWQISSGYQHAFADAAGNDILSVEVSGSGNAIDIDVTNGLTIDEDSGANITVASTGSISATAANSQNIEFSTSGSGQIQLTSSAEVDLNAPTVDIHGNVNIEANKQINVDKINITSVDPADTATLSGRRTGTLNIANLLSNPGFENGTGTDADNWTEDANAQRTASNKYYGEYSIRYTVDNLASNTTIVSQTLSGLSANTAHVVSFYAKGTNGGAITVQLAGGTATQIMAANANPTNWTRYSVVLPADNGASGDFVITAAGSGSEDYDLYIDAVMVEEKSSLPASDYFTTEVSEFLVTIGNDAEDRIVFRSFDGVNDYTDLMRINQSTVRVYGDLVVDGTTTTLNSNIVNIGDNMQTWNADITTSTQNSDIYLQAKRVTPSGATGTIQEIALDGSLSGEGNNQHEIELASGEGSNWSAGEYVEIYDCSNSDNNGIYRIDHITGDVLVLDKTYNTLTAAVSTGAGSVRQNSPAIIRWNESTQTWQIDQGDGTFRNIATTSGSAALSLQTAYEGGSTVSVDDTNVVWTLDASKSFTINDSSDTNKFVVTAGTGADSVKIDTSGGVDIDTQQGFRIDDDSGSYFLVSSTGNIWAVTSAVSNGNILLDSLGSGDATLRTASGTATIESTNAAVNINAGTSISLTATNNNISLTTSAGNISFTSAAGLTLKDQYLTSAIPLSETGTTGLDARFTATSIIGAINEALDVAHSGNTLDEVYSNETGTRIITMDNGSVEWQITDNYQHSFADSTGNDILAVKALAAGDQVVVTGILSQSDGQVTFGGNVDANAGLDVTGALTQTGGQVTFSGNVDAAAGLDVTGNLTIDSTGDILVNTNKFTVDGATGNTLVAGTLNVAGEATLQSNLVVQGNLTVQGTQTIVNTETIELADNIIVLNSNFTGSSPTENAGIEIERGTATNVQLFWDETNDAWAITDLTGTYYIAKTNGTGTLSLDEAYNGGSVVTVDTTDVDWQLGTGRVFKVTDSTDLNKFVVKEGNAVDSIKIDTIGGIDIDVDAGFRIDENSGAFFSIASGGSVVLQAAVNQSVGLYATGTGGVTLQSSGGGTSVLRSNTGTATLESLNSNVTINAGTSIALSATNNDITLTTSSGNISLTSAANLNLKDQYLSSAIPLSETGVTGLDPGFTATSIIGALNEALNAATGANTLDEVYDGETGTRIITMDNGSVEWQITDNYQHNFADAAGNDILSIKALASGDQVDITGILSQSGGQVTFNGNVDATAGLDVTGALTQQTGQVTFGGNVDANAGLDVTGNLTVDSTGDILVNTNKFTVDGATGDTSIAGTLNVAGVTTLQNNLVVQGNLTVQGTQTIVNTETIELADNIIVLNSNYTGSAPTENAGIEVERGTATNVQLFWDETNDAWAITDLTGTYFIAKTASAAGALSLDEAYNGGSIVDVDTNDVDWQMVDGRSFKISTQDTGNPAVFTVSASAGGDSVAVSGDLSVNGASTFTGTFTQQTGQVTFGGNVDANAGLDVTGVLTQTGGQVTFNGNVDATSGLDVTGALTQATGQVTFNGNVDANAGLDITGALTQTDGAITINANAASSISVAGANLGLTTNTSGNISLTSAGEIEFNDSRTASAITLSDASNTAFADGVSTSLIGAINRAYQQAVGGNTLDEVYDGETGNRIITMDNGSVEWQITDNYEHNFADAAGNDILSIKALAAGDRVDINGILNQSGGQVTFNGNVDANAGLDVTGALTQSGGAISLDGNADSTIKTSTGYLQLQAAAELYFSDSRVSSIPLTGTGVTGLDTTAQNIIGAINEAFDAIKLGYEEQQPDATEAANDYIVLEDSSVTDLLPTSSATASELRAQGIFVEVYLNGVLLSQNEWSYGYVSGEKRIEYDGTGANAVDIDTSDIIVVKVIKKTQ